MTRPRTRWVLFTAGPLLGAILVFWSRTRTAPQPATSSNLSPTHSRIDSTPPSAVAATTPPSSVDAAAAMVLRIEDARARLLALAAHHAGTPERAAATLALRTELRAASQASSAEAIALFLESGHDAPTGLMFVPAPGGFLETAPTLRTMLLDELERFDTARAREAALAVFASSTPVADEWSLALRITAHSEAPSRAAVSPEFVQHVHALLDNQAWLAAPSAGFLHGFDAAVYSGDAALVDRLASLSGNGQTEAVKFAARLALDRTTMTDFASAAGRLLSDPALLAGNPEFRGRLFARADVGDSAARRVVERFLTDSRSSPAALQAWAEHFPHRSKHLSDNLLTRDRPTPVADLARMDRAALAAVREWQANPTMATVRPLLAGVQTRLEQFVASADRGDTARAGVTAP